MSSETINQGIQLMSGGIVKGSLAISKAVERTFQARALLANGASELA